MIKHDFLIRETYFFKLQFNSILLTEEDLRWMEQVNI